MTDPLRTTAEKLARLVDLDEERTRLTAELRQDFDALRAALPRTRRTPKAAPKAAKRGRPRKASAPAYTEPDSRD